MVAEAEVRDEEEERWGRGVLMVVVVEEGGESVVVVVAAAAVVVALCVKEHCLGVWKKSRLPETMLRCVGRPSFGVVKVLM